MGDRRRLIVKVAVETHVDGHREGEGVCSSLRSGNGGTHSPHRAKANKRGRGDAEISESDREIRRGSKVVAVDGHEVGSRAVGRVKSADDAPNEATSVHALTRYAPVGTVKCDMFASNKHRMASERSKVALVVKAARGAVERRCG
eukprot:5107899-Pleurochrysis_carterae.AAC.2